MSMRKGYRPNTLERVIIGLLGLWNFLVGVYATSPFYLNVDVANDRPTLRAVLEDSTAIHIFGIFLLIDGACLIYSALRRSDVHGFTSFLSNALLGGFLLRLYSTIGTTVIQHSWRPPTWVAPILLTAIYGAFYLWIRVNERTLE